MRASASLSGRSLLIGWADGEERGAETGRRREESRERKKAGAGLASSRGGALPLAAQNAPSGGKAGSDWSKVSRTALPSEKRSSDWSVQGRGGTPHLSLSLHVRSALAREREEAGFKWLESGYAGLLFPFRRTPEKSTLPFQAGQAHQSSLCPRPPGVGLA